MIRKVLSILLVLFWMGFIFSFSGTEGDDSGSLSVEVLTKVIEVITPYKKGDDKMNELVDKLHFPFRKLAHFTVYFVLGVLVINVFLSFNLPKYYLLHSLIICVLYAVSDELHQLFVSGRTGNIADVLLDSSGALLAIYLTNKYILFRGKYEKKVNK